AHGPALATARTRRDRVRAARALAADYRGAARRLAALTLSPADYTANHALVAALRRVDRAYAKVAKAAARPRGDAAVPTTVAAAQQTERDIDGALAGLRAAGYSAGAGRVEALP